MELHRRLKKFERPKKVMAKNHFSIRLSCNLSSSTMAALGDHNSKASETAPRPSDDPDGVLPASSSAAAGETEKGREKKDSHDDEDADFDQFDDAPPPLATSATFFRLEPSEEALAEALALKAAGNEAFGQGSFGEAVAAYKRALDKLGDEAEEAEREDGDDDDGEEEENKIGDEESDPTSTISEEATELGATLHANLSASYLKLGSFREARDSADAALRLSAAQKKTGKGKKREGTPPLLVSKALLRRAAAAAGEGERK